MIDDKGRAREVIELLAETSLTAIAAARVMTDFPIDSDMHANGQLMQRLIAIILEHWIPEIKEEYKLNKEK